MINLKANKKLIQQSVQSRYGKKVNLKDIHNIAVRSRSNENTLEELVSEMKKVAGTQLLLTVKRRWFSATFFYRILFLHFFEV